MTVLKKLTGLKRKELIGKKVTEVIPGIESDPAGLISKYGNVVLTGEELRFEEYFEPLKRYYSITAYKHGKNQFAVIFEDITERKHAEEQIKDSLAEKEILLHPLAAL